MKKSIFILWLEIFVLVICFFFLFFFYGPFSFFRNYFITSAMTTYSHQFLAYMFYTNDEIVSVMKANKIVEKRVVTDLTKIKIRKREKLYSIEKVSGSLYTGYLVKVYDPTRISLITSKKIGIEGEDALTVSRRNKAQVLINSVGFYDPDWSSNGAIAHGTIVQNGQIVSQNGISTNGGGFVGFTYDGKLFLGDINVTDLFSIGIKDAVQFGPYLIINGQESAIKGDGGWGIAPRTAIGQRRDGVVLFLVINGRIPSSIGARMKDLVTIMKNNGAYNAVNMDGGSSSVLILNDKIMNKPVGGGKNGLRKLPAFWIVK